MGGLAAAPAPAAHNCHAPPRTRHSIDRLAAAAQLAAVDERVGHGHDVRRHAVLPAQPADRARVGVGEALEERDTEAARGGARLGLGIEGEGEGEG